MFGGGRGAESARGADCEAPSDLIHNTTSTDADTKRQFQRSTVSSTPDSLMVGLLELVPILPQLHFLSQIFRFLLITLSVRLPSNSRLLNIIIQLLLLLLVFQRLLRSF